MPGIFGITRRALPAPTADGTPQQARFGRYGEQLVVPLTTGHHALADEGQYFKALNPTPGTGIAQTVLTAFLATNGLLSLKNNDGANGKRLFPDFVRLIPTVVGTSTTRTEALVAVDSITRYSSGGSALTPVNANMDSTNASIALVHFGALTLAGESVNVRRLARFQLRAAIMVQFEEFLITFGRPSAGGEFNTLGGTAAQRMVVDAGPAVVGPGQALTLHVWNPGNVTTPPSWEVELGWWER